MLLLLAIGLLFMILSIMWYLLVRDVIFEDFNESEDKDTSESASTNSGDDSTTSVNDDTSVSGGANDDATSSGRNTKESYVCLKNDNQYLVVNSDYKLGLGRKASNAIFKIVDEGGTDIQLESLRYPGYYVCYGTIPCVRTDKYARQTRFIPMGYSGNRKIALIPSGKKACLENQKGSVVFTKYFPDNLRPTQLFKVEKAHVTH